MSSNGSKIGLWIAVGVLAMFLMGSFLTNLGLMVALVGSAGASVDSSGPKDDEPVFTETWSSGYGDTKVVRMSLSGAIMRGRRERLLGSDPDMVESLLKQIKAATNDSEVKAILLEVNSPGGAVTPSDEIYEALRYFKSVDEERRILVFIRGLGASGAYYAAMASDYIVAEPTSIIGSVGVIMQTMNMKELGEKLGISSVTIASGENKDMLNPLEDVDPQHRVMLQELVDGMQDRFASIVETSRGFENRDLLDGRVFSAPQALEHNFIDGIGYWRDAVSDLSSLLGEEELYIVRYESKRSFFDELMASKAPSIPSFDVVQPAHFMYIWKP